jgi:hypothetical protein
VVVVAWRILLIAQNRGKEDAAWFALVPLVLTACRYVRSLGNWRGPEEEEDVGGRRHRGWLVGIAGRKGKRGTTRRREPEGGDSPPRRT